MIKYAYMCTPQSEGGVIIHIPTVTVVGPPGSKEILARCGNAYGMQHCAAEEGSEARLRAKHQVVRLAVLQWLSNLEDQWAST